MRQGLLGVLFVVSACGGGGAGDDVGDDDVAAPDAGPDAPSCVRPTSTVFEAGSAEWLFGLTQTSTGAISIDHQSGSGRAITTWDGSSWVDHTVYANANGGFGTDATSEIDGRPVVLATINNGSADDGMLRYWSQLAGGDFATGQLVPNLADTTDANAARYVPADGVLSVVATGGTRQVLYSLQHVDGGAWTVQPVHQTVNPYDIMGAGVGELDDGTALVASYGIEGLWLHRRVGQSWNPYKQLATGDVFNARVAFPPVGSTGGEALAVYVDPVTENPRGVFASLSDGTSSGGGDLLDTPIHFLQAQIWYAADGASGTILLWDENTYLVHMVRFEGTSFLPAQELRPDLVFESFPRLVSDPCGDGPLVYHTSRDALDPPGAAGVLEPLADFAEGQ